MFEAAEDRAASGEPAAVRNLALARTALRFGPARERAGQPAAWRDAAGPAVPDRARQGSKERLVPISSRADARSRRGWNMCRAAACGCSRAGRTHISRVRLFQIVRAMAADAGICARPGQPARPSPRLRNASAVGRRGPSRAPVAARPCRHRDHANLHPRRQRAAGRAGEHPPPARDRAVVDLDRLLQPRRRARNADLPRFRKADRRARNPRRRAARDGEQRRHRHRRRSRPARGQVRTSCCATPMRS